MLWASAALLCNAAHFGGGASSSSSSLASSPPPPASSFSSISATTWLMNGRPFVEVEGNVRMLGAFALAAVAAGAVLFRYVVED